MSENYKPIIHQYRRDLATSSIVAEPRHEEIIVNPNMGLICLTEIPQEWERVKIFNITDNMVMSEVYNIEDIKEPYQFYVVYENRTIYFHRDVRSKLMAIDYHGIGGELFSANSIYTKTDGAGNVIETIQDILDAGEEAKEVIIKIDGVENVVSYLDNLKVESRAILDEAAEKVNKLDDINNNINTYKEVINNRVETFETTINNQMTDFKDEVDGAVEQIKTEASNTVKESKEEMNNSMNKDLKYYQEKLDSKFAVLGADVIGQINDVYNRIFPVGYVYQSTKSTSPVKLFGGEWDELGIGQVLVGAGTYTDKNGETKTFTVGETYGEFSHKLTMSEIPAHTTKDEGLSGFGLGISGSYENRVLVNKTPSMQSSTSLMQPSTTVYRWVRTKLATSSTADLPNLIVDYLLDETINTRNLVDGCVTLDKLAIEVLNKLDKIDILNNSFAQIKEQFDSIVASAGNDNSEIVAARTNKNGKEYTTLGSRLDSMETEMIKLAGDIADTEYKAEDMVNVESLKMVQIQKMNSVLYQLRNGIDNVTFCHMGDSLTFGVDTVNGVETTYTYSDSTTYTNKQATTTYPQAMEDYLKKVYGGSMIGNHINRGRGGDCASMGYKRHNAKHTANATIIMYGTNDSRNSTCPYVGDVEQYLYWMEQIVIRELLWGKAVVLLSSPIVKASNDPRVDTFSNAVKMLGVKYCIPVVDTQELVSGYPYDIWSDATHLTAKGYTILGTRLASCFVGEGIANPNKVWGGCLIPIGAMKGSYVIKGDILLKYSNVSTTDIPNDYGETTGYWYRIENTDNTNEITFSFYTEEENVYAIPSLYLRTNTSLKLTLDNGYIGTNQLASSVFLSNNSLANNSATKIISSVDKALRYNKIYCRNNCDEPLRIPNRGWHTLTISVESKNSLGEEYVGCIYGVEFVSYDNMNQILSSPILLSNNPEKASTVGQTITLDVDITKLNKLVIQTGIVADKTLMTSTCKPYSENNFRTTDIINCITDRGRFKATITNNTTLTIVQSDDIVRYIWGAREI